MLLANENQSAGGDVVAGNGFWQADLGFVVHFKDLVRSSPTAQQVGRAGAAAVDDAYGILLSGREDDEIQDYFIRSAFPAADVMLQVLAEVEREEGASVNQLMARMNYRRGVIEKALKLLEVDGAVVREKTLYARTPNRWTPDFAIGASDAKPKGGVGAYQASI
jgi:ATP-dependent DNA helicase RecQ